MGYASQTVRTTLDSRLQAAARRAVERAALGGRKSRWWRCARTARSWR
jgi:membrane carboxypeptidase/penicillin-binding protein